VALDRWEMNARENAKLGMIEWRCMSLLADRHRGKVAVVVGAGPSLDLNFHRLKRCRRRGLLIIATDGSLPSFSALQVRPDYVVSGEETGLTAMFLRGFNALASTLICSYSCNPEFVKAFGGRHYFYKNMYATLRERHTSGIYETPHVAEIDPQVPNVGFHAVAAAKYLGVSEVALIGFDMGVADRQRHHAKSFPADFTGDHWPTEDMAIDRMERNFERDARLADGMTDKRGIFNCTEGGMLRAFQALPLAEFLGGRGLLR